LSNVESVDVIHPIPLRLTLNMARDHAVLIRRMRREPDPTHPPVQPILKLISGTAFVDKLLDALGPQQRRASGIDA
jgi:hypothetical protein